jgi:hypothetical protein
MARVCALRSTRGILAAHSDGTRVSPVCYYYGTPIVLAAGRTLEVAQALRSGRWQGLVSGPALTMQVCAHRARSVTCGCASWHACVQVAAACHDFRVVDDASDSEIAADITTSGVHILVDLAGHALGARAACAL